MTDEKQLATEKVHAATYLAAIFNMRRGVSIRSADVIAAEGNDISEIKGTIARCRATPAEKKQAGKEAEIAINAIWSFRALTEEVTK